MRMLFRYNNKLILIPLLKQRCYNSKMHFPRARLLCFSSKLTSPQTLLQTNLLGTISLLSTKQVLR